MATAEERAAEVERRIREVVDGGRFVLGNDYQHACYQDEQWMLVNYKREAMPGECGGCALGSLAFALGKDLSKQSGGWGADTLREFVESDGIASYADVLQLEMGYENYGLMWGKDGDTRILADINDPFYKLGEKLREVKTCLWNRPANENAVQQGNG